MTRAIFFVGMWLLIVAVAVLAWVAFHEISWRLQQRRRRSSDELTLDLTRRARP